MKVVAALCAFAYSDKLGGYVLTFDDSLPSIELTDESPNSLDTVRHITYNMLGIKDWQIYYKQVGTYEHVIDGEKKLTIVYMVCFDDIPETILGKWMKINDLSELNPECQALIRYTATQRV